MLQSTLKQSVRYLSSLRLTVAGLICLLLCIIPAGSGNHSPSGVLLYPLCLLAVNLLAAIISNSKFHYQPWLLAFHVGLLFIVALSAIDYMMRFEARVEIAEGQNLSSAFLMPVKKGGWYDKESIDVDFTQGPVRVGFHHGLNREKTYSTLTAKNHGSLDTFVIGDQLTYTENGYRFSTTSNKGYAAHITWYDRSMKNKLEGNIHFPSFPFRDWQQKQVWTDPDGTRIEMEMVFKSPVNESAYWEMRSDIQAVLKMNINGLQYTMKPGQIQKVNNGSIVFEDVRLWMGYRVDYNPVLPWLFSVAMMTVFSLFMYLRKKLFCKFVPATLATTSGRKHGYASN